MIILLHVDDLMISCEYQSGIDYVITSLNKEYSRANVYDTFTPDFFLDEVAVVVARAKTPAAHYLYNVDNESESLSNNERGNLHSLYME